MALSTGQLAGLGGAIWLTINTARVRRPSTGELALAGGVPPVHLAGVRMKYVGDPAGLGCSGGVPSVSTTGSGQWRSLPEYSGTWAAL